mgnify:CR=1 FL=1
MRPSICLPVNFDCESTTTRSNLLQYSRSNEDHFFVLIRLSGTVSFLSSTMEAKYNITKELGRGTWGVVYGAIQKETGRAVAVKKIKSMNKDDGINFTAIREIK